MGRTANNDIKQDLNSQLLRQDELEDLSKWHTQKEKGMEQR